jgi:hypothetical protein
VTLKVKLKYDFESLMDSEEIFNQLKAELYLAAKKFGDNKQLLSNVCVCISYLTIQSQNPEFTQEMIEYFNDSLMSTGTVFKILKEIPEQVGNDDIVISDARRRDFYLMLTDCSSKVLLFLDKWAENANTGKITTTTPSFNKWEFINRVSYILTS